MLNINLFAGPGTGKSTTAAGIFHLLKKLGYSVEYIQEYAKDLTFSGETVRLADQVHILGEQHHRLHRLKGQVDIVIHDSPFIMGMSYVQDVPYKESFKEFTLDLFGTYNNINIFLERDVEVHKYQDYGRSQTLEEAITKDEEIRDFLMDNQIEYSTVRVSANSVEDIVDIIRKGV